MSSESSEPVLLVEGLGKKYRLGTRGFGGVFRYGSFRDSLAYKAGGVFRALRGCFRRPSAHGASGGEADPGADFLWALKDASFQIAPGEVVGIIGKNGAGKSTLLKILSRITEPTEGSARIRGRVGSLLEVGTGFHPELSGGENIYLNGAILGMRKREIERKFDEIVAFAELERFIDTPVKRYSSGMYVRLAFAVAAHLEPEILLVDEVLAVGDVSFQKKCLGKMGDVAKTGRTILFVSHNMTAVKTLCSRAILLRDGRTVEDGPPSEVVNAYLDSEVKSRAEVAWEDPERAPGSSFFRLKGVRIRDKAGAVTADLDSQQAFTIEIEYWNTADGARLGATVIVHNQEGTPVFSSLSNHEEKWHGRPWPRGLFRSVCRIPGNFFPDGRFSVSVSLWGDNYSVSHREDGIVEFVIHEVGGVRGDYLGGMDGVVRPLLPWTTDLVEKSD